jgi:hypothetical protein
VRLHALLGFWILMIALYAFLKQRLPLPYALMGMVFPMLTFAWFYAFEARAYGIVLGCAGVLLIAWQAVAEDRRRGLSLAAMALAMAVALASHAFGVLLAIPIAVGEVVRSVQRRRVDFAVWVALAAAAPLVLMYPGILAATRDWDSTGMQSGLGEVPGFYDTMFRSAVAPLLMALLAACLLPRRDKGAAGAAPVFPRHETAALVAFAVVPVLLLVAGRFLRGFIFYPRYCLPCVIGVGCGLVAMIYRAAGGSRRTGTMMLLVLVAWLGAARGRDAFRGMTSPVAQFQEENPLLVEALADGRPVMLDEGWLLLAADFYLPDNLVGRLYFVTDLETAPGYVGQARSDRMMTHIAQLPMRVHVEGWKDFASRNPRFLLQLDEKARQRTFDLLLKGGWSMTVRKHMGSATLYEVSRLPAS